MRIGIIGAMEEEIQLILNDLEIKSEQTIGMRKYYSGKLLNKDVVLVFSRWGKVAAASTATTLIQHFNVDLLVFTGVAGAADSSLRIGDVIISDRLVQHDIDTMKFSGLQKFEIPLLGKSYFVVNDKLVDEAIKSAQSYIDNMNKELKREILNEFGIKLPKVVIGTIASGDQFIADKSKIDHISSCIDNLKCIEMEGAAVAQVCFEHNINFIVFRVISDKADSNAKVDFQRFVKKAASHFTSGIIKQIISDFKQAV